MNPIILGTSVRLLAGAISASFLLGCSPGNGKGLNVSGRPLDESADVPLAATLESIQANVFDPSCVVCHSGAAAPLGLRLDAANSFIGLVAAPSRQDGSLLRVDPGDPDRSYLIQKLEGTASEGEQMPLGGAPIPQATIDFVRQWILDGALPDSTGSPGGAPVVVSLTPEPGSISADFPAQVVAGFDQDIDASTVNELTFTLTRSVDGQFDNGDDVAIAATSVALSPINARLAIMDLAGVAAVEDRFRVTLEGSGPNVILSVNGAALDGEFAGSLPSGDSAEGGDFTAEFEVAGLQATLSSIQANVFGITCATSGCHTGPAGPGLPAGMDLSSENSSFQSLVNVQSIQDAPTLRVIPGDADGSYLIRKLEGSATVGGRMPLGGPALDPATIAAIREWIDSGAAP